MPFADLQPPSTGVTLLQRSLERGRLGHAYLFAGDRLEELEAVACALAQTLNCKSPSRRAGGGLPLDACGVCVPCRKIAANGHADVTWLRPESKLRVILVDQIRSLLDTVYLKPTEGAWKVGIIVGADRLNVQAANAFLKTLEEPPSRCVLLLLTTEPQRVLETIQSRCLRLTFSGAERSVAEGPALAWLRDFGQQVAGAQGGLLPRYRILGQMLAELDRRRGAIEEDLTARSPLERYDDVEPALREQWETELAAAVEAEYRRQRGELLVALQWWLRDVWLATQGLGAQRLRLPEMEASTAALARRIEPAAAAENLRVIERTQRLLFSNVQEALALEVGLLKLKL
jgi:DNA polymerase-3 subunit delta'